MVDSTRSCEPNSPQLIDSNLHCCDGLEGRLRIRRNVWKRWSSHAYPRSRQHQRETQFPQERQRASAAVPSLQIARFSSATLLDCRRFPSNRGTLDTTTEDPVRSDSVPARSVRHSSPLQVVAPDLLQ